jgi:glycosyltransferase involved in cell wall biosynthesis
MKLVISKHSFLLGLRQKNTGVSTWNTKMCEVAVPFKLRMLVGHTHHVFAFWNIGFESLLCALFRKKLVYLSWGYAERGLLRTLIERFFLRRCKIIFVNELITKKKLEQIVMFNCVHIPFYIDRGFFCPDSGESTRQSFLFCNGENGRSLDLINAIADAGFSVIWCVGSVERFSPLVNANVHLVGHLSYEELRDLYRKCSLFIMPLSQLDYCSGQTTCMEALSCGARVLISSSVTSNIFSWMEEKNVVIIENNMSKEWVDKINDLLSDPLRRNVSALQQWPDGVKIFLDKVSGI